MHKKDLLVRGKPVQQGTKILVMLHGRGGSAEDIMSVAEYLPVEDFTLIAPRATNNTWYPYSFMAKQSDNEPWLGSALSILNETIDELIANKVALTDIYLLGFSQGACLTLEFVARNARRYGGVIAFTGGLIGDVLANDNYRGNFEATPFFIGSSDPDPHVPVSRVRETEAVLKRLHAEVDLKIYPEMGHTINQDELLHASKILSV